MSLINSFGLIFYLTDKYSYFIAKELTSKIHNNIWYIFIDNPQNIVLEFFNNFKHRGIYGLDLRKN